MKEKETIGRDEAYAIMGRLTLKIEDLLRSDTEHLKDSQRWVVVGRVVNNVFGRFYLPSLKAAESVIDEKAKPVGL